MTVKPHGPHQGARKGASRGAYSTSTIPCEYDIARTMHQRDDQERGYHANDQPGVSGKETSAIGGIVSRPTADGPGDGDRQECRAYRLLDGQKWSGRQSRQGRSISNSCGIKK